MEFRRCHAENDESQRMKSFSPEDRIQNIRRLNAEEFDLVIIGGGITGAGVARDAARRGMKVALVEVRDFASGTSSRSSKLIHGGIRYLENLEFKLVFEALSERNKLFQMAPHLVHPLRFMIPLYKSSRIGMFKLGLGMWVYEALSLFQSPELHERLDHDESLRRMPFLRGKELLGSYIYSDAYMDDDRLVHETLRSANRAGAVCANYVYACGATFDLNHAINGVECQDMISKKKFTLRGRHVVSTVGPWTDLVGHQLLKEWKNILRPTKGIHLTFEKKRLPLSSAVVMAAEKRIVFGIPRHDMVIVGTTDTDYHGKPEDVHADVEDVKYLLSVIDRYFPGAIIQKEDIVASYAGVRPLVHDSAETEGKTSREHTIFTTPQKITFAAGGKYTTYRLMAEQIINETLKYFPIEDRVKFNRCTTAEPLNPLVTQESQNKKSFFVDEILSMVSWPRSQVEIFFDRHGPEALEIIRQFGTERHPIELEALHAIENTMCLHLVDFYSRRVPLFLATKDHGERHLSRIIKVFSERLAWTESEIAIEQKMLDQFTQQELSWKAALN
jgi:glycerol-3-phosphate dehydrogenase